jgi:hypothetical protein
MMLLFFSLLVTSGSVSQAPPTDAATRPCEAISGERTGAGKSPAEKKKPNKQESVRPAPNCLEVRLSAIDTLEYLQKFIREQQWFIKDEQASEETSTFIISLNKEMLARYTKPFADPRMRWRGGKGLVQIRAIEENDGYTHVLVSARFDGFGESADTLATKRDAWPMESNGILESELISAIGLHVRSSH